MAPVVCACLPSACRGEQRFDVDVPDLERRYKALQRRLHPDKFSTASSLEQEYAHQQARQRPPALAPSGELRGFRRPARVVPRRLLPWPLPLPSTLQAAVVNQAYDVLKAPLRRAHYIVSCDRAAAPAAQPACGAAAHARWRDRQPLLPRRS